MYQTTPTCINCSEKHLTKNCKNSFFKCVNCSGNHKSIDKNCPQYKFHQNVLVKMYQNNLTFNEAIKQCKPDTKQETRQETRQETVTNKSENKLPQTNTVNATPIGIPLTQEINEFPDTPTNSPKENTCENGSNKTTGDVNEQETPRRPAEEINSINKKPFGKVDESLQNLKKNFKQNKVEKQKLDENLVADLVELVSITEKKVGKSSKTTQIMDKMVKIISSLINHDSDPQFENRLMTSVYTKRNSKKH